jgi:hypothetical protein
MDPRIGTAGTGKSYRLLVKPFQSGFNDALNGSVFRRTLTLPAGKPGAVIGDKEPDVSQGTA